MIRRDFLKYLLATPIATQLDVEKLLWIPEKTIFIPSIYQFESIYGIPYHQTDASMGTWLGFSRIMSMEEAKKLFP